MNLNNEMRFNTAGVLTKRIYGPRLKALAEKTTTAFINTVGAEVAKVAFAKVDFSRFDSLKPEDVPELNSVSFEFDPSHGGSDSYYTGPVDPHGYRDTSVEYAQGVTYRALTQDMPLLNWRRHSHSIKVAPVRIPYKISRNHYRSMMGLSSACVPDEEGGIKTELRIQQMNNDGEMKKTNTSNRVVWRLWRHFMKQHEVLKEAMEFHMNVVTMLKGCRTMDSVKKKWPDIYEDFVEINGLTSDGKQVSVDVVPADTLAGMNSLLKKHHAEQRKAQEAA